MICENCGKEHDGSYGSGRFCSKICCSTYNLSLGRHKPKPNRKYKGKGNWECKFCHQMFDSRRLLQKHRRENNHYFNNNKYAHSTSLCENPICSFCGEKHETKSGMTLHQRLCKKNPNRDINFLNKLSEIHKNVKEETRLKLSQLANNNHFWKYKRNSIIYESKQNGSIRLDSSWELIVAKRLDELNLNWCRPNIRLPYIDKNNIERGYFPDFYVKDFKCFIEVKHPYYVKEQNENGKIDYLKSHYDFIFWIEDEDLCYNFELYNMNCPYEVEKEVEYLVVKRNEKTSKEKKITQNEKLKEERWQIIQNSNIDFQKFGWVGKISKLFGVSENCGGRYIRNNFPEFYKKCFKCKNLKLDL